MNLPSVSWRSCGRTVATVVCAALLAGCGTISHKQTVGSLAYPPPPAEGDKAPAVRHIAIFFDGTNNDEASDTNVKRLHSLVSLRPRSDLYTLWVEGVGTGTDVLGMTTAYGFKSRVQLAYAFVLKHYRPGTKIYVFGFSRGAYAARVLNSLLYHAGVPLDNGVASVPTGKTHADLAESVYDTVKMEVKYPAQYEPLRRERVQEELVQRRLYKGKADAVEVELLGLWDTVEALGIPDLESRLRHKAGIEQHLVDVDNANSRYGDKLCNVRHAFHALSMDDNREWIFTPLLLARRHLFAGCSPTDTVPMLQEGKLVPGRLREVWFAGAHSDVGGGYSDTALHGVSLNWMMDQMREVGIDLVAADARVPADPFGTSHNPEGGAFAPVYHAINRDVVSYVRSSASLVERLCVHPTVFERRKYVPVRNHENHQLVLRKAGTVCLGKAKQALNSLDANGRLEEKAEAKADGSCPEGTAAKLQIVEAPLCWK